MSMIRWVRGAAGLLPVQYVVYHVYRNGWGSVASRALICAVDVTVWAAIAWLAGLPLALTMPSDASTGFWEAATLIGVFAAGFWSCRLGWEWVAPEADQDGSWPAG